MTIRVLIVDDSGFFRRRLAKIISADHRLTVVGVAENSQRAIDPIQQLQPDIVMMDIEMPVMDGMSAVKKIMASHSVPVLMLSAWTTEGEKATLGALEASAIDYLPKRLEALSSDSSQTHQLLCQRLVKIRQADATTWDQDEYNSTIFGMPKAVIEARLADSILNISHIGTHLSECT